MALSAHKGLNLFATLHLLQLITATATTAEQFACWHLYSSSYSLFFFVVGKIPLNKSRKCGYQTKHQIMLYFVLHLLTSNVDLTTRSLLKATRGQHQPTFIGHYGVEIEHPTTSGLKLVKSGDSCWVFTGGYFVVTHSAIIYVPLHNNCCFVIFFVTHSAPIVSRGHYDVVRTEVSLVIVAK